MSQINLLRILLRLLTPEEILELTTISNGKNRLLATQILEEKITKKREEQLSKFRPFIGEPFTPSPEGQQNQEQLNSDQEGEQKKGVVFILDLKRKLEGGQRSLKEIEVRDLYQKAAGMDVDFSKANKDDLKKSSNLGVLINKKQS